MLYGVTPRDPGVLTLVAAVLTLVAFGATIIPSRRAIRISPVQALRDE